MTCTEPATQLLAARRETIIAAHGKPQLRLTRRVCVRHAMDLAREYYVIRHLEPEEEQQCDWGRV